MLTILLVILHVLACLTLIAVILLQAGRGHGLTGSYFGTGGPAQSIFGTKTADVLSKATTVMAICFLITCISLDILQVRQSRSLLKAEKRTLTQADLEKLKEAVKKIYDKLTERKTVKDDKTSVISWYKKLSEEGYIKLINI